MTIKQYNCALYQKEYKLLLFLWNGKKLKEFHFTVVLFLYSNNQLGIYNGNLMSLKSYSFGETFPLVLCLRRSDIKVVLLVKII